MYGKDGNGCLSIDSAIVWAFYPSISGSLIMNRTAVNTPKPEWLKKKIPSGQVYNKVFKLLRDCRLHTVCEEAHCPNLGDCFSQGTATFMILGDRCTRSCNFCAVRNGSPLPPDGEEPEMVSRAVETLGLRYAVITSVTRDDLHDGGASHFAETIQSIRSRRPKISVEVLIPDFQGSEPALKKCVQAGPDVINHNLETVPRLYPEVRQNADYSCSLQLLHRIRDMDQRILTKSGLMLGLGEKPDEVLEVLKDLLDAGCSILTLGQYLCPSPEHHRVMRFVPPQEFSKWEETAYKMGFQAVASGPFVRSSFQAAEMFKRARKSPAYPA